MENNGRFDGNVLHVIQFHTTSYNFMIEVETRADKLAKAIWERLQLKYSNFF